MRLVIAWHDGAPETSHAPATLAALARLARQGHQLIIIIEPEAEPAAPRPDGDTALERALRAMLPPEIPLATLLTQVRVDPLDPAQGGPARPVGPVCDDATMRRLAAEHGWRFVENGGGQGGWRRAAVALRPIEVLETGVIRLLAVAGAVVVCRDTGVPVAAQDGRLVAMDAAVDFRQAGALLASRLDADRYAILGGFDGIRLEPGRIARAAPTALAAHDRGFADSWMAPVIEAAVLFAGATGRPALVGARDDLDGVLAGRSGSWISSDIVGLHMVAPGAHTDAPAEPA